MFFRESSQERDPAMSPSLTSPPDASDKEDTTLEVTGHDASAAEAEVGSAAPPDFDLELWGAVLDWEEEARALDILPDDIEKWGPLVEQERVITAQPHVRSAAKTPLPEDWPPFTEES